MRRPSSSASCCNTNTQPKREGATTCSNAPRRARVSFGSRGLSPTDGSAGALLDSIETQAGTEAADARSLFDWRLSGLDAGLASSLARIDDRRSDLLSGAHRTLGQVNQLLRWRKGMSLS